MILKKKKIPKKKNKNKKKKKEFSTCSYPMKKNIFLQWQHTRNIENCVLILLLASDGLFQSFNTSLPPWRNTTPPNTHTYYTYNVYTHRLKRILLFCASMYHHIGIIKTHRVKTKQRENTFKSEPYDSLLFLRVENPITL